MKHFRIVFTVKFDKFLKFRYSSWAQIKLFLCLFSVKQMIYTKDWLCIWQTQSLDYCAPNFDFVEIKYDRDSDWFFLEVKEFKLEEKCHLQVEFLAEHDYHWKRNMVWDFLELREIQQQAYNPLFKK